MKTFLKLIVAVAALGIVTASAQGPGNGGAPGGGGGGGGGGNGGNSGSSNYTPGQAAAIKAVTDALKSGDTKAVKAAVSKQVAEFPELAGDIVSACLEMTGISTALLEAVVNTAAFTAPFQLSSIIAAIQDAPNLAGSSLSNLITVATQGASDGKAALQSGEKVNTPEVPPQVS